jgi:hypothetical protein
MIGVERWNRCMASDINASCYISRKYRWITECRSGELPAGMFGKLHQLYELNVYLLSL